jgi:hypothetical protein
VVALKTTGASSLTPTSFKLKTARTKCDLALEAHQEEKEDQTDFMLLPVSAPCLLVCKLLLCGQNQKHGDNEDCLSKMPSYLEEGRKNNPFCKKNVLKTQINIYFRRK